MRGHLHQTLPHRSPQLSGRSRRPGLAALPPGPRRAASSRCSRSPSTTSRVRRLEPVRPTGAAMEAFGWALAATHARRRRGVRPAAGRLARGRLHRHPAAQPASAADLGRLLRRAATAAVRRARAPDRHPRRRGPRPRRPGRASGCGRVSSTTSAPPARIHGDLWAGNLIWTADRCRPDRSGGARWARAHRPGHAGAVRRARPGGDPRRLRRGRRAPDGWRDLIGLHQLHPLLVHAVTHGPRYGEEAGRVAQRYACTRARASASVRTS